MIALLLLAAQAPSAPSAPPSAPAAATPVDPARLAAAKALIDQMMPPAQREAMMRTMLAPMLGNMEQAIGRNPEFAKMASSDPRVKAVFQRFLQAVVADSMTNATNEMPRILDAMAFAYARQFTVAQLDEVRGFYASPTGHEFMAKLPLIMSDPSVQQAQRDMMNAQLQRMPALMKQFQDELAKLHPAQQPSAGK